MITAALVLSVLTLNIAGPRRIHQGWQTRRAALTERLKAEKVDAAVFQELWRGEDLDALALAAGLKHSVSDLPLGLAAASRYPLENPVRRDLGWGGGALRVQIRMPGRAANLYSVRLTPGDDAHAAARRLAQLFDLAEFVRQSTGPFILLGDLAAPPDDPEIKIFLDLLGARDLCVAHGDEACGRTLDDKRVDYALIPYTSRPPKENARAAFTEAQVDDDEVRPLSAHFGLTARLDASWLKSSIAAEPEGRLEALGTVADALDSVRNDIETKANRMGWIPWMGTRRILKLQTEIARLVAATERARTALALAAKPSAPAGYNYP